MSLAPSPSSPAPTAPSSPARPWSWTAAPISIERDAMISGIPVIDLTDALGGNAAAKRDAAAEMDRACREIGFFTIIGHGVPIAALEDLRAKAHGFFAL